MQAARAYAMRVGYSEVAGGLTFRFRLVKDYSSSSGSRNSCIAISQAAR